MEASQDLTVREACSISKYSRVHIYQIIFDNRVKWKKVIRGRPILLIDRESLLDYMRKQGRHAQPTS
jgi:hypothetical protein